MPHWTGIFTDQLIRKTQGVRDRSTRFSNCTNTRSAPQPCARRWKHVKNVIAQRPSDDSLRNVTHFAGDMDNTASTTYLIMKTGGGNQREGGGRGIHWHIVAPVLYYSEDPESQVIPYVRVMNEDGTYTEYTDIKSGFDPATLDESKLRPMDCITCHNRITHEFALPPRLWIWPWRAAFEIDPAIPLIRGRRWMCFRLHMPRVMKRWRPLPSH